MADRALTGTIEQIAEKAQEILRSILPEAYCLAQEWDNRIDCMVNLLDGSFAGEMVTLPNATEKRIVEAGERLKLRTKGIKVLLENELWQPIAILPDPE